MKKLALLISAVMIITSFTACSARTAVEPIDFKTACTDAGLIPTESDTSNMTEDGLKTYITATADEAAAQLMVYDNETSAKTLYAQIISSIKNENGKVEKKVDSSTYNKFFQRNGDTYEAVVRIGSSVFYGRENTPNGIIETLLEKIDYK